MSKRVRTHVNPLSITHEHYFKGFGNRRPIVVDVGAFKGEFSWALSEKLPDYNFILFEIRLPVYQKLVEKFKDCPNVAIFPGDAARNFRNILQPCLEQGAKVEYIFINFPDPWLKDRHKKRRFIRSDYLQNWSHWLNPDALFVFQTDQPTLFEDTLGIVKSSPFKYIQKFGNPPFGLRTDWEEAKIAEGKTIDRMGFSQEPFSKEMFYES